MTEMLSARYKSKYLRLLTSLIVFIFLVPYAAGVYSGLGYLFEMAFGIPFWVVIVLMATLTAIYLVFGGYLASAITNFAQGFIMLIGIVVMVAFVLSYDTVGGLNGFADLIMENKGFFVPLVIDGAPYGYSLLTNIMLASVGVWGLPQIINKFYTIKSEKAIKPATWVSTIFCLVIGVGAYLVGTFAPAVLGDEIATMSTETIIPTVISRCLESGFLGLIIILILSASMSTLSSIALASSSSVAVDIYKGYIKKEASDKEINILLRLLCFVFIVISVLFALLNISSIVALMSFSWGTLSGCFLAPYIYGLYSKRATKAAAYTAIFAGLAITLIGYILSVSVVSLKPFLTPPAIGVAAMTINMILMPIVSRFTTPLESSEVDKLMVVLKQK